MASRQRHHVGMSDEVKTKKRGRVVKWFGGFLLILVLVIVGCEVAGWPFLRQPMQQLLQDKLHRDVLIERPFKLQLFGGVHLQIGHLRLAAPEGFDVPYLVDAHGLDLALRYRDFWQLKDEDAYRIQAIRADRLDTHLIRHADGKATWDFELDDTGPKRPFPMIEVLAVNQGQAKVLDTLTKTDLAMNFFTEEGAHLAVPESSIKFNGQFRQRPLQGELLTHGFLPVATQGKNSPPLNSQGWLKYGAIKAQFKGAIYDLFGTQRVKGSINVSGPSLADVGDLLDLAFPRTPAFKIAADIERGVDTWQVNVPSAQIGQSRLNGKFTYESKEEKPKLSGELNGALFVLADLAPAFGAPDAAQPETANKKRDRVFPDASLDFGTYDRMNADIKIHLDTVDLGNAFKERISPLALHLILQDNKLTLADLDARTAQGSLGGELSIDAHMPVKTDGQSTPVEASVPDWNIQLTLNDIRLEKWLKVSPEDQKKTEKPSADKKKASPPPEGEQSQGLSQPSQVLQPQTPQAQNQPAQDQSSKEKPQQPQDQPPAYISGIMNGKAKLQGRGRSTAALLNTLDGQVALLIHKGEISHLVVEAAGLDIAQAVGVLIKGDQAIPMQCAAMGWYAKQGVLTPEAALIDTPVTTVTINGDINLGQELLNLRLQASPKNFSPFTIRSPILVTGPFIDPKVSLSPGPIAARVAGGVLLAMINPFAAILPFLDPGSSEQPSDEGCQQTLQQLKTHAKK
jgi:AsmA family protein